jgi:hypothetical protein
MKKTLLTLLTAVTSYCAYSQVITDPTTNNVGIGVTSPISKLDVGGILHISYPGILNYPAVGGTYIGWNRSGGGGEANFINNIAGGNVGGFTFDKTINGSDFTRLFTIADNGNIGIGTVFPASKLTILGNGTGVSIHPIGNSYYGSIAFNRECANGTIYDPSGSAFQINNGGSDHNMHFPVYNGQGVNITGDAIVISGTNGNVGIGTATPQERLSVNGKIRAQEVKVETANWPDYVFRRSYKLAGLDEVKAYIDQNHHLPDMPSEQDVKKEGLNLGEMDKLLTQKIEELTLYLIGLKKDNDELKRENKTLKEGQEKMECKLEEMATAQKRNDH